MSPPRVLIGCLNIGNNIQLLARGFREIGFEVKTAAAARNGNFYAHDFDFDLAPLHALAAESIARDEYPEWVVDDPRFAPLFDFDLYVFVASHTLLPGLFDLPLLKARGKAIISFQTGSEIRFWQMARTFNAAYGHIFPDDLVPKIASTPKHMGEVAAWPRYLDVLSNKLHNIRMAERYADALFSQPRANVLGVRPYMAAILPLDASRCTARIPGRTHPVVVHAPTNPAFKQSALIMQTLERLWKEGVGFELRLLRNLPNERVLEALTDADVLIDQIYCGKPGLLGYEGMASGCVVLGGNLEDPTPVPHHALPVIDIVPDRIFETFREVLGGSRDARVAAAEAGVQYLAEGHHTPARIAQYLIEGLERSGKRDWDYYPCQYIERPEVPSKEVVPAYLKEMTLEVMADFGVPPGFDGGPLERAGLLPGGWQAHRDQLRPWDLTGARRTFWGHVGAGAVYPHARG
jgi:hypothetical protein